MERNGSDGIRDLAVELVDTEYGYTVEQSHSPEQHRARYNAVESYLRDASESRCPDPNCHEGIAGPDEQRCVTCGGSGTISAALPGSQEPS